MEITERLRLIKSVGEEILTEEELQQLLEQKKHPIAYDGFEPSGKMHIAQGLLRAITINKMIKAGCHFKMWVADWHAWANNKLGGNLDHIQTAGNYFIEIWKSSGMDLDHVEFVWANDVIEDREYWKKVMSVATKSTLKRIVRCSQIMGRSESDLLSAAQILYPCMQCADIFHLKADITQLGMDQRKVNVLAREIGPSIGFWKPVVVSHHMLLGLQGAPQGVNVQEKVAEIKMSKSQPDSSVFMTDTREEIELKITKAYCPEKVAEGNPILEISKLILFEKFKEMTIERDKKFGGDVTFVSYMDLEKAFMEGKLHPVDLKKAVSTSLNTLLDPVRMHFQKNAKAKRLLEQVYSYAITR